LVIMKADLIRYARRHSYHVAEGFVGAYLGEPDLPVALAEVLDEQARELSVVAGISLEIATSAIVNRALNQYLGVED